MKIGPENLTKIILAIQGFITIVGVIIAVIGSELHRAPMLIPFCKGISYEFFTTLRIYQGDHKYAQIGNILLTFNYLLVQSILILEIILYVILFKAFRQSDKKMEGKISASHSKKRFRKNTVNLMGQVVGFAIETVYLFGAILFMFFRLVGPYLWTYFGLCSHTFVALAMFLASPELRRHYLKLDF